MRISDLSVRRGFMDDSYVKEDKHAFSVVSVSYDKGPDDYAVIYQAVRSSHCAC